MIIKTLEDIFSTLWKETPYHLIVELLLLVFVILLVFKEPRPIKDPNQSLTAKEEDDIINDWKPEPLVPDIPETEIDSSILQPHTVTSGPGPIIEVDGKSCHNFGTPNLFGLNMDPKIIQSAVDAVEHYAVGACGPRQFYGTMDAHLNFEKSLATWVGTEDAVNYCYPFATTSSVIQAFVAKSDICFVDEKCWFAVNLGADLSRSKVIFYHHNDLDDLKNVVREWKSKFHQWEKCNRWVVAEGIFSLDGSVLDLPKLIEIRKEFCLRVILDETISFGSLGETGRGVCEHFRISRDLVEVSIGSLGPCFGSLGGFTIGTKEICSHQRLASYAYIFSASPPCFSVAAASKAIEILQVEAAERIGKQRANTALLRGKLKSIEGVEVLGDDISPLIHLKMKKEISIQDEDSEIQMIVDKCLENGLAISKTKFCRLHDKKAPRPTLKLFVSPAHSEDQILAAASILKQVIDS